MQVQQISEAGEFQPCNAAPLDKNDKYAQKVIKNSQKPK
jgi:hypothetical protein